MRIRIKNVANRPIPVEDESPPIPCGEIVEVELTPRIESLIKNHFFEDLGEAISPEIDEEKDEEKDAERPVLCNDCEKTMDLCTCQEQFGLPEDSPSNPDGEADPEVEGLQQPAKKEKPKKTKSKRGKKAPSEEQ